jgi:hypothetical protein
LQNQSGKDEPLERVRDEIVDFAKKEAMDIFWGNSSSDSKNSLPEIRWQPSKDWRLFVGLAKSQGINLLVVEERTIGAPEFEDIIAEIDDPEMKEGMTPEEYDIVQEVLRSLRKFSKYTDKVGGLMVSWVKDSTRYSLYLTTKWFEEMHDLLSPYLEPESDDDDESSED